MADSSESSPRLLELRRTFNADPSRVFNAWTDPQFLRKWWGVAEGYTTPIAEVDLRIGGSYRLGMLSPDADDLNTLAGEYLVIETPDKLVFTWGMEIDGTVPNPSTITIQLTPHGAGTMLVLMHEYVGTPEMAENFRAGWTGMLARLGAAI
jgi:uncharacterized protein YndB with AHSA1/START domain